MFIVFLVNRMLLTKSDIAQPGTRRLFVNWFVVIESRQASAVMKPLSKVICDFSDYYFSALQRL